MSKKYIDASQENGKRFVMQQHQGSVVMLNLLKFNPFAQYPAGHSKAPAAPISGKEAYQIYIDHTLPFLQATGAEVLYYGDSGHFLIGPEEESWDAVLLVKHASVEVFLGFAQNQEYLAGVIHREAALEDSRLLPIYKGSLENL